MWSEGGRGTSVGGRHVDPAMTMKCPKCVGDMRSYERNGVTVDQCEDCRGLFLDRGELEHLISAEASWNEVPQSTPAPPREDYRRDDHRREDDRRDDYRHQQQPYRKKKKRSFFEDLFD